MVNNGGIIMRSEKIKVKNTEIRIGGTTISAIDTFENPSYIQQVDDNTIEIFANETYGFNSGQNIDIKTGLNFKFPKNTHCIIKPEKPLLMMGQPFYDGGALTLRFHNSYVGKNGAYIISKGEPLCKLIAVKQTAL